MGISFARGMRNNTTSSRVRECTIPEMGVLPPFLILAAVLAIAPVAGIPPKQAEPILATPWATSSMLERCLELIILSATTAESRDSMPASSAMVRAFGSCARIISRERTEAFKVNGGNPDRILSKAVPMVMTSNLPSLTIAAVTTTAIREPGIFLKTIGHRIKMASASTPISAAW